MNMMTISKSLGEVLYSKGIFGHITVDLVSFPDPTSPQSHPLFWAVDLNCGLTDYATACFFFDFLMVTMNLLTFYRRENLISSLENTQSIRWLCKTRTKVLMPMIV
jgi:hypothetical protein